MKFIAHRGNLTGKIPERENHPDYILEAIKQGYDVEIDVWYEIGNGFFLGHDKQQYDVKLSWLQKHKDYLWCHAKNLDALNQLINHTEINSFWHQQDDYTLTTHNFIWTYPNKRTISFNFKQIILLLDWNDHIDIQCGGICSDDIILYKNKYQNK